MREQPSGRKSKKLLLDVSTALHLARQNAAMLDGLLRILALDVTPLSTEEDEIRRLRKLATDGCKGGHLPDDVAEMLITSFAGVTDAYWRLSALLTGESRPWGVFIELFRRMYIATEDPVLRARLQHTANVCRQTAFLAAGGQVQLDHQTTDGEAVVDTVRGMYYLNLEKHRRRSSKGSARGKAHDAE